MTEPREGDMLLVSTKIAGKSFTRRTLVTLISLTVFFFLAGGALFAQGVGGRGPKAPGARTPSGPKTSQPKGNSGAKTPAKQRGSTLKELEEARIRERERQERAEDEEKTPITEPEADKAVARVIEYLPLDDDDLKVLSMSWSTEARRGSQPFTVLKMRVANRTNNLLSLQRFRLTGSALQPFRDDDDRPLPGLPSDVDRFETIKGLSRPIQPHSTQSLTFAFPYALKPGSDIKAEVNKYVKFKTNVPFDWNPVKVVRWTTCSAQSGGVNHQGLFVTVQNRSGDRVRAKLKVTLDGMASAGGRTFFFTTLSLGPNERKNVALRTIPDEGIPLDDPARLTMPETFKVQKVEVADIQY